MFDLLQQISTFILLRNCRLTKTKDAVIQYPWTVWEGADYNIFLADNLTSLF